jgi:hypothetical protein
LALASIVLGCGNGSSGGGFAGTGDGGGRDGTAAQDGTLSDATGVNDGSRFAQGDGSGQDDSGGCNAPDMLIVLDHTDSMSAMPNGKNPPDTDAGLALTKWYLATAAIGQITMPPADQTIRFGLELFPLDPQTVDAGAGKCETVFALLGGKASTNTSCEPAEIAVAPALGTGAAIAGLLDPATSRLCVSTPIAKALATAQMELAAIATAGRPQYVMLVTDGGETCMGDVPAAAQALAASGIKTYVVGFGGSDAGAAGVNVPLLNNVACAGRTATNFATSCVMGDGGGYTAVTPKGPPVFFLAEDGASLSTSLKSITGSTCCGCAQ